MSLDSRFSAEVLRRLSLDDDRDTIVRLIDELEAAVLEEVHTAVAERLDLLVERLNGMGHRPVLNSDEPCEIEFTIPTTPHGAHCWLRLGIDVVVSPAGLDYQRPARVATPRPFRDAARVHLLG